MKSRSVVVLALLLIAGCGSDSGETAGTIEAFCAHTREELVAVTAPMSATLRAGDPRKPDLSREIASELENTASAIAADAPEEIADEVDETVGFYRSLGERLESVETPAELDDHAETTLSESVRLTPVSRKILDFTNAHCDG